MTHLATEKQQRPKTAWLYACCWPCSAGSVSQAAAGCPVVPIHGNTLPPCVTAPPAASCSCCCRHHDHSRSLPPTWFPLPTNDACTVLHGVSLVPRPQDILRSMLGEGPHMQPAPYCRAVHPLMMVQGGQRQEPLHAPRALLLQASVAAAATPRPSPRRCPRKVLSATARRRWRWFMGHTSPHAFIVPLLPYVVLASKLLLLWLLGGLDHSRRGP